MARRKKGDEQMTPLTEEEKANRPMNLEEVMEYLRVAPLLLYTELAKPAPAAAKPSLH